MARFRVTIEQSPGIQHPSTGMFIRPLSTFEWPDDAPSGLKPSLNYQPLDQESYDMLVTAHGQEKVTGRWGAHFAPPAPKKDEVEVPKTPAEMAEAMGMVESTGRRFGKKGSKRLSDE